MSAQYYDMPNMENIKLTKADIVGEISKKVKMRESDVQVIVEEFMKLVNRTLIKGGNVYLRNFGTFYLKKCAQKVGRNIKYNKPIIIPEHYTVAFKPSKHVTEKVKKIKVGSDTSPNSTNNKP